MAVKDKKQSQQPIPVTADPRFTKLHFDPRFIRPKKDASKLKIDSRFASMLNSEEFGSGGAAKKGPKVDKYGRPYKSSVKKDLQRFYKLEEEEENAKNEIDVSEESELGSELLDNHSNDSDEENGEEEEIAGYRLARGEGLLESSDEEDDDTIINQEDEDEGILGNEEDVPLGEETHRFAVVNLDWDYIRAKDLYKLFDGFKPTTGLVRSVRIYPSEFGKERMAQEERSGPVLFQKKADEEESGPLVKEDSGEEFDNVALRKYQLERLKYYYAIVDCDSVKTAKAIYEACDGAEFEASANFLDLRYVPDGTTFDDEAKDEATEAPVAYQPAEFTTRALQHSKVKLTWDEDDHERTRVTHRKFTKEDLKDMDFKAYLASDSDEEEGESENPEAIRAKYKALLGGSDEENNSGGDAPKEDMEITFISGLSEKAAGLLEKRKEEDARKNETVFEAQLRKRREKRKERRKEREAGASDEKDDVQDDDLLANGEEIVDEDDPFFQLENESDYEPVKPTPAATFTKKKSTKKSKEELDEEKRSKAELELLLMDENESAERHYNMKSILQAEKEARRNRKKNKKKAKSSELDDTQEDFQLDVQDSRFAELLDSHHFAIDPTNPQFKKTKNMERLLQMRRDRRTSQAADQAAERADETSNYILMDKKNDLSTLVASIKRKTSDQPGSKQGPKRPRF